PVFLPGGACIGYSAYAMHRSAAVHGAGADAFRPERWLEAVREDPPRLPALQRSNDLIFGHGKSQCLGKPVAQLEIGKTIFEVSLGTLCFLCWVWRGRVMGLLTRCGTAPPQ